MEPSLSVILPVHNAQQRLAQQVADLLDVLPEMTPRFEVLVVDDGSTDDTAEIAGDLSAEFPQVRVVRHPVRLGLAEAIQTGIDRTDGEVVLVGDEVFGLSPDDMARMWTLRDDEQLVVARQPQPAEPSVAKPRLIDRVLNRTAARRPAARATAGIHLIRREQFEELRRFERERLQSISHRVDEAPLINTQIRETARPNFLAKLKQFALGE